RQDIPDLLRATDISILTSSYEGVSNALMESMCVGLPVVSTAYAGADELVTDGHDGLLDPLGDAPAFAECLLALLADPATRERLGAAARRTIESRYSLEAMVEALLSLYQDRLRAVRGARPRP
ncbi:MAG: glycosyltransferase family 4 protein, partial [Myxococcota bacterium]